MINQETSPQEMLAKEQRPKKNHVQNLREKVLEHENQIGELENRNKKLDEKSKLD